MASDGSMPPRDPRDLRILVAGSMLSTAGDVAAYVALVLRVRPSGPGYVAALTAAEFLPPLLLVTVTGLVVDRFAAKRVQIVCLLGQAATAAVLTVTGSAIANVVLVGLLGCFWAFSRPAFSALIPHVTGEEHAAKGYSSVAVGQSVGWVVGPAAGGLLAGHFGVHLTLAVDALTFLVLAGSLLLVRANRPGAAGRKRESANVDDPANGPPPADGPPTTRRRRLGPRRHPADLARRPPADRSPAHRAGPGDRCHRQRRRALPLRQPAAHRLVRLRHLPDRLGGRRPRRLAAGPAVQADRACRPAARDRQHGDRPWHRGDRRGA